jgi:hypothetical protein
MERTETGLALAAKEASAADQARMPHEFQISMTARMGRLRD